MFLLGLSIVSIILSAVSHSKIAATRGTRYPADHRAILYLERIFFLVIGVGFILLWM